MIAALLLLASSVHGASPAAAVEDMKARGYEPVARVAETLDKVPYAAVLYRAKSGEGGQVDVYVTLKGKELLIYTHPSVSETPALEEAQPRKKFGDFLKDGSKTLVYRMTNAAMGRSTLVVLRKQGIRFSKIGSFPEGRVSDLDGDGQVEIVARTAPLGRVLQLGCGDSFGTTVSAAMKTQVYAWDGRAFADVSARHVPYFETLAKDDSARLEELSAQKQEKAGAYVSAALTLYFDLEAAGKRREGWARLSDALDPKVKLPGAADCVKKTRAELREKLAVPSDW